MGDKLHIMELVCTVLYDDARAQDVWVADLECQRRCGHGHGVEHFVVGVVTTVGSYLLRKIQVFSTRTTPFFFGHFGYVSSINKVFIALPERVLHNT
jgi:hypothetical protein